MHRILVIGSPGAGKSTLATRIAGRLGLPIVHLDQVYWQAGWVETPRAVWRTNVERLAAEPAWVMDGNYSGTFDLRVPRATAVVWLDCPRWRCLARILRRVAATHGRVRADMAPGCPERFDGAFMLFVWNYPARSRAATMAMLAGLRRDQRGIVLRSPAEVRAFEAGLPATLGAA